MQDHVLFPQGGLLFSEPNHTPLPSRSLLWLMSRVDALFVRAGFERAPPRYEQAVQRGSRCVLGDLILSFVVRRSLLTVHYPVSRARRQVRHVWRRSRPRVERPGRPDVHGKQDAVEVIASEV